MYRTDNIISVRFNKIIECKIIKKKQKLEERQMKKKHVKCNSSAKGISTETEN